MTGRTIEVNESLERLRRAAAQLGRRVRFMEVCGTHTVNALRAGLHSLMPANVMLLSGPGCPVCVTSQGDIDQLVELSLRPDIILCTYGDMLRVTGRFGSLEDARARGASVHIVYSSLDAVRLAEQNPNRQVVLAAVGFETTAPATAVAILTAKRLGLSNFTALTSHKMIIPAMRALLEEKTSIDGFICPGHVSVIIGSDAFRPIVREHKLSCVVTGFEGPQIAAALARLCELALAGAPALENLYPQAVTQEGNRRARKLLEQVFDHANVTWRGLGALPASGLILREAFHAFDARLRHALPSPVSCEPRGCRCGDVITGRCTPADCKLFATACTPVQPVGP